ncbi:FAD-binding oxidoreductase [Microbacterium arabinogalactanolyticum]|uniref:FAD-binding oxidoreductase n=1 Tax=Microbacterium arabinogalactanolyticum TaxID=69365 RepID=UPI00255290A3|nr:FAD-binding protein [Microbacterium arabinogalactanolyticum]GLC86678.1 FAD-linked oxidase [Microbacterium arabinogalactanolyticum]
MSSPVRIETAPHTAGAVASALRGIDGILTPGDAGYDQARLAWNLAADQHPAGIAAPEHLGDVLRIVRAAALAGARIAPQSTGHNAMPLAQGGLDDALLLRLHALTGVDIDVERRTARVIGGTLWRDVIAAAAPRGLTALHGSAGDVAVAGYVLGGGLSFYGRAHGLAAHSVRSFDVVTSSGELVHASPDSHAGLFWALRGGDGGNFGVVVAIELDLLPLADVHAGFLLWDISAAPVVLPAWRSWTEGLDHAVTTSLRMLRFPPLPELPPFLSGRSLVIIDGAVLAEDHRAAELLGPLRELQPELDTFARMPAIGLLDVHMDPPVPSAGVSDHLMLGALGDEALADLLAAAGPDAIGAPAIVELRQLGGALAEPEDAALSRLDGEYTLLAIDMVPVPEMIPGALARVSAVAEAMRPWADGAPYLNFVEAAGGAAGSFQIEVIERLHRVRALYDPMRRMCAAHPLPAMPGRPAPAV